MSQPLPHPPNHSARSPADDPWLQRGREVVTALLALIIVIGTVLLIANAFRYVSVDDTKDQSFQHAKDLLNIVLPLLGVVLGYYFNKVSTEKRAETAERSAQTAMAAAEQATEARQNAQIEVQTTKETLRDVSNAAEKLIGTQESMLETLGDSSSAATSSELARAELKKAVQKANRYLG